MASGGTEDAARWLRRVDELALLEDGEGDPRELLEEEIGLLRLVHSEDVETDFLRRLWEASGSWEALRQKEATLRALANEHAAAAHWVRGKQAGASDSEPVLNWELLRPVYVPELPTEVATAVMNKLKQQDTESLKEDETTSVNDAEKYVLEKDDNGGVNLFLDPNNNLLTMTQQESGTGLAPVTATSPADIQCASALYKVCCNKSICEHPRSLCWHCWRQQETQETHLQEFRDLLSYARTVAETAAPLQRAAETALRWPFLEDIASATVTRLEKLPAGTGVLVLGGVGVTAIRAAKECAAKVWIWEPQRFLATTARAVVAANGTGNGSVEVIQGDLAALEASLGSRLGDIALIAVEGLEMDGLLGFGALKQLRAAQALLRRSVKQPSTQLQVLPTSLSISVRLADARVTKVSEFDFSAFARVSKAFAPFLSAVATNATSAVPVALTDEVEAFQIQLEAWEDVSSTSAGRAWDWPDDEIEKRILRLPSIAGIAAGSMASSVLVGFNGSFGDDSKRWGESIFYVPPIATPADGAVLRCFRNSAKIWFEVGSEPTTGEAGGLTQACGQMPLHGPPFGHAFLQEWYLDMYRDVDRNDFYEEGLRRWVKKHRKEKGVSETCGRVMDIGSGTGLLLFFALRAGAAQSVGVEVAPNLKRMSEALYQANMRAGNIPKDVDFKVIHNDALRLNLPEEERPDCLVTEMMDGSGLGENMVHVILHAKAKLLASGAETQIVPRRLVIKGALLHIRLPCIGGVDLSPFEAFWGPTRALGCEGEFANVDLDNPEAGACDVVSEVVQVWDVDFAQSAEGIAEALRSRMVDFPLTAQQQGQPLTVNAVAWWFEAHLDDAEDGDEPPPVLTNVPKFLRKGNTGGGTHWHQAVSVLGPFERKSGETLSIKAHTDGKKITWTSKDEIAFTDAVKTTDELREAWLDAARKGEEQAQRTVWQRQRLAEDVSDAPRIAALQAAAMHVGTQPGLFGVFGGASVASHILKEWFGAGCSAGF